LERESFTGLAIMFQIRKIVVKIDSMVLEESMDLHSGVVTQETAQLSGGELALPISFEGNGFEGSAGWFLAGSGQEIGEFIGELQGDLVHGKSIAKVEGKSTLNCEVISSKTPSLSLWLRVRAACAIY
jgi:hypothetical protein